LCYQSGSAVAEDTTFVLCGVQGLEVPQIRMLGKVPEGLSAIVPAGHESKG
jgi:hypothetical protein